MKTCISISMLLFFAWQWPSAQPGYEILKDVKKIDIPFEFKNNLILVNVTFHGVFPLKFIFDTGAENTILSNRSFTDILGIPYEREFKIIGSDMRTELSAYLVRGIYLNIEDMVAPNHSMLVLKEDYFNFEELIGLPIHGILGADLFKGLTVKINYEKKIITLSKGRPTKEVQEGYQVLKMDVKKNKPYLETFIKTQQDSTINVRLLLDTGAMLSLLLNSDTHPGLKPPPNTISGDLGIGLGGLINGHLGRVNVLQLGNYQCNEVITNFQYFTKDMDTLHIVGRNGIIGNEVLSRFHVILDYPSEQLYLRPNRYYRNSFEFDKSGLVIIAGSQSLNQFLVHSVIKGSPADLAGIKPGDEIKRINLVPATFLSLNHMHTIFKKKVGKQIKIVVKRDGKRQKLQFKLRKLI